jgi:hypothetical protein
MFLDAWAPSWAQFHAANPPARRQRSTCAVEFAFASSGKNGVSSEKLCSEVGRGDYTWWQAGSQWVSVFARGLLYQFFVHLERTAIVVGIRTNNPQVISSNLKGIPWPIIMPTSL